MTPSSWRRGNSRQHHRYAGSLLLPLLVLPNVLALQVVPGSNCSTSCLSRITGYTTNGSDITCHDSDYNRTVFGSAFQECVTCEMQSETFNRQTGQTDLGWALCKVTQFSVHCPEASTDLLGIIDNMRYALDWCLFDYPESKNETASNTCKISCAPIANALETNILTPNASTTYDYCHDQDFLPNVGACASCYKIIPNQLYISNCKGIISHLNP